MPADYETPDSTPAAPSKTGERVVPLPPDQMKQWKTAIDAAESRRKLYAPLWDKNLEKLNPSPSIASPNSGDYSWVDTRIDFQMVELKKAQLFHRQPDVVLTPLDYPIADQYHDQIRLHQEVLKFKLGPNGANVRAAIDPLIVDLLCPAGIGAVEIGYRSVTVPVEQPGPLDPLTGAPGKPISIPVPVWEECFWDRLSPKKLLIPAEFDCSDYDRAPWLGYNFLMAKRRAEALFGPIPDDAVSRTDKDEHRYKIHDDTASSTQTEQVKGVKIWYRASLMRDDVIHPDIFFELVLLEGMDDPIRHRPSPYQSLGPDGRLTADSMRGNPIHVATLRVVPDTAYPPSDSTMIRPQVDELNKYRQQQLRGRDASMPVRGYDEARITRDIMEAMRSGTGPVDIPMKEWDTNNPPLQEFAKFSPARDQYQGQEILMGDIERTLAMGDNQKGKVSTGRRSATEIQAVQASVETRLAWEQDRIMSWYVAGVSKFDALLQRFGPESPDIIAFEGDNGQPQTAAWDKHAIAGRFLYTIRPHSQLHLDQSSREQRELNFYNLTANDPNVNRSETLRDLALAWGKNTAKLLKPPPEPQPAPLKPSLDWQYFSMDTPMQFGAMLQLLEQAGYKIDPQMLKDSIEMHRLKAGTDGVVGPAAPEEDGEGGGPGTAPAPPQPPHGGPAVGIPPISKKTADLTGELPGLGSQAPPPPVSE